MNWKTWGPVCGYSAAAVFVVAFGIWFNGAHLSEWTAAAKNYNSNHGNQPEEAAEGASDEAEASDSAEAADSSSRPTARVDPETVAAMREEKELDHQRALELAEQQHRHALERLAREDEVEITRLVFRALGGDSSAYDELMDVAEEPLADEPIDDSPAADDATPPEA